MMMMMTRMLQQLYIFILENSLADFSVRVCKIALGCTWT